MKPIATFDLETDPFKAGRIPRPFAADFFDGERHSTFWGENCVRDCWRVMRKFDGYIYAHNGGKFDFHYLLEVVPGSALHDLRLIKSRISTFKGGLAEFRDSWLLVPTALRAFAKTDIDYRKLEADVRNQHRAEIIKYLKSDTENLRDYILAMIKENGFGLTIAGRTFAQLKEKFDMKPPRTSERYDRRFRKFYFGGRVEFFKLGELKGPWQYIDINSAYPRAMLEQHPFDPTYDTSDKLPKSKRALRASFVVFDGLSRGALPVRSENGGVDFPTNRGRFFATGWEIEAGKELGLIDIERVVRVYTFTGTKNFRPYVEHYYGARMAAKASGDRTGDLLNKLVLNSLYGRFALNPREFHDVVLLPTGKNPDEDNWEIAVELENGLTLWRRKHELHGRDFFNVATAASITGWVRAYLLRALRKVGTPVYCDTDSIVCREIPKNFHLGRELGEWKIETEDAPLVAIAAKKLYAMKLKDGTWKVASKGVKLNAKEICAVARGEEKKFQFESPNFSLISPINFVSRTVRRDDLRKKKT